MCCPYQITITHGPCNRLVFNILLKGGGKGGGSKGGKGGGEDGGGIQPVHRK